MNHVVLTMAGFHIISVVGNDKHESDSTIICLENLVHVKEVDNQRVSLMCSATEYELQKTVSEFAKLSEQTNREKASLKEEVSRP